MIGWGNATLPPCLYEKEAGYGLAKMSDRDN